MAPSENAGAERDLIEVPFFRGGGRQRLVALTFDDGPNETTTKVLEVLERWSVRATFFFLGKPSKRLPAIVARASTLGEVGNHSWNHRLLNRLAQQEISTDLERTGASLRAAGGGDVRLFRPPHGLRSRETEAAVHDLGLLEVLWSINPHDWRCPDPQRIAATVIQELHPGAIVLLHSVLPQTVEALPLVLGELQERRYQCVTIPELIELDPPRGPHARSVVEA